MLKNHVSDFKSTKSMKNRRPENEPETLKTTITNKELNENLNEWKFHFVISQIKNLVSFKLFEFT